MKAMQADNGRQAGNIAVFIIVGVVLAALLAGGIYVSKQQGRVASRTDRVAVDTTASEDTADNSTADDTEDMATPSQQPRTDTSANTGQSSNQTANNQNPTQPSSSSTPTASQNRSTANQGGAASTPATQVPHTGPSAIASTGPSDVALPVIVVSLVVAGMTAYVRSVRSFRASALK